jgi:phosphoglycolate phosphatase
MTLPHPKAVIFDWDNTLVDTWPIIHAAMSETFIEMGQKPWTIEQTKARVKKSMRDAFPELFGPEWEKAAEMYQAHYRARHLLELKSLPLSVDVLKAVKAKGLYSVVVSNKKGPNLRKEIEHFGWAPLFDKIVGADDAKFDKPHVAPVEMAFEKSGITPGKDVWFIGDSDVDLECALNVGCTAILYGEEAKDHPDYSATHFQGFPYHAHVHNHTQTLALLNAV